MAHRDAEHADSVQPAAGGRVPPGPGTDRDGNPPEAALSDAAPVTTLHASKVGSRLRAERERRGISLRELARRVGVSPSLVSQIELDRVNPSVSTLYSLVTELGMTMSDVFGDSRPGERTAPQVSSSDGLAESPETRRVINLASGVRWERLTPHSDRDVEFLYVTYPVGAESCPEDALMTHGGREYGYVTSGKLGVRVGFDEYELEPGGSIAFDSSSPHRLWAIGDKPVHAVWVVIGRKADPRGE
jgi:transcriptional regulator with XRE-family HTH domain